MKAITSSACVDVCVLGRLLIQVYPVPVGHYAVVTRKKFICQNKDRMLRKQLSEESSTKSPPSLYTHHTRGPESEQSCFSNSMDFPHVLTTLVSPRKRLVSGAIASSLPARKATCLMAFHMTLQFILAIKQLTRGATWNAAF